MKRFNLATSLALLILTLSTLSAAPLYWDADGTAAGNDFATGTGLGGSGNWDHVSALWFNGLDDVTWINANADDAILSGTGGDVTLTEGINAGNLLFTNVTGNFVITNATGAETLTLATGTVDTGGGDHTIGALLGSAGTLTKLGGGRVRLTGNNAALSGLVLVNEGVVSAENNGALGSASVTVATGAALEVRGALSTVPNTITLDGAGITNGGALRNTAGVNNWYGAVTLAADGVRVDSDSGTLDFFGGISGSGNLNLLVGGAGTVRIDAGGINLGTGTLTQDGGTLAIAQSAAYATTFANLVVKGAYFAFNSDVNLGTVPGSLLTNQVTLDGGTLGSSGTIVLNANRGITVAAGGGVISPNSGALTTAGIYSSNVDVTFYCYTGTTVNLTLGGTGLALGTGRLIKTGNLTMSLGTNPNVCGKVVVNGGALLWGSSENRLGTVPASATPDAITLNGGALTPSNTQTINANRGITLGAGGGSVAMNTAAGILTIPGVISGSGNLTKLSGGAGGIVKLTANNTYTGNTIINGNILQIGNNGITGTLGTGNVTNSGGLLFSRSDAAYIYGGVINGTGGVTNTGTGTMTWIGNNLYTGPTAITAGKLQIGTNGTTGTLGTGNVFNSGGLLFSRSDAAYSYGGVINGTGGVTNLGSGAVTLTGNNLYTGPTAVNSGKLLVNNISGSGTGSGSVMVASGGTLGGSGAIGGAVTVSANGTLAPGALPGSVGTLTINNSLNLAGNLAVEVNKSLANSNDLLVVTGTLSNTGAGLVTVSNLGSLLVAGDTFKLFSKPVAGGASLQVSGALAVWNNNLAVDGTISVARIPVPAIDSSSVSGDNFVLSGTNGNPGGKYLILSSTNVASPLTDWVYEATNSFDANGAFSFTSPIVPDVSQKFYLLQELP
jgi:fibronectin-binding autotransporter adhesin